MAQTLEVSEQIHIVEYEEVFVSLMSRTATIATGERRINGVTQWGRVSAGTAGAEKVIERGQESVYSISWVLASR